MRKGFIYLVALAMLASCSADPTKAPIISVDNAQIGGFPRTVNLIAAEYDLNDLQGSSYLHELDFRTEDGGANVANYNIFVTFDDNDPSNGDNSSSEVLYKEFGQSDFSENAEGNKSIMLDFPFTEVAAATGTPLDAVSPGDRFQFRSEIVLSDGRVFSGANTEATIFGPAFRAFFDWNVNATCPLPDDFYVGTYAISHIEGPNNPWGTGVRENTVTLGLVPGSTTRRAISGLVVIDAFGGFEMAGEAEFICDIVVWNDANPGVGCGPAGIFYNGGDPQPFSFTDDSTITFVIEEDGGSCGYSNTDIVLFTKQ